MHSPAYGVPINRASINDIRTRHLPLDNPPGWWSCDVVVGVPDAKSPSFKALKRVSPEEFSHAILFAVRDAIEQPVTDDIKRRWLTFLRNQTFTCMT